MKKLFTLLVLFATLSNSFAATYRTYVGYTLIGNTYTIYLNSDTAVGETALAEIQYNGGTYTGLQNGSYGPYTINGTSAHWSVSFTLPSGATGLTMQLATKNQSGTNYGFSGFSSFGNRLAVEISSFFAKKTTTAMQLSWQTASEQDNASFQIERSANAVDFSPIGEVKGAGNSKAINNYTFTDATPLLGVNYYRLQALDYFGKTSVSKIVAVNFTDKNTDKISAFPNPAGDVLRLDVTAFEASNTTVSITDLAGRVLLSQNLSVNKGANQLPLAVSSLSSGMYLVKMNETVLRFVKQ